MSETFLEVRYLLLGRRGGRGYRPIDLGGDPCNQYAQQRQKTNLELDPLISLEGKKRRESFSSKAIIDTCRPFSSRNERPEVSV